MVALKKLSGTRVLVRGLPGSAAGRGGVTPPLPAICDNELNIFDHLSGEHLTQFLAAANRVVCRSGYTSVMELAGLGKRNVVLVPTPGQPEQEYLGDHLQKMRLSVCQQQETLDLEEGFGKAAELPGFVMLFQDTDTRSSTSDLIRKRVL